MTSLTLNHCHLCHRLHRQNLSPSPQSFLENFQRFSVLITRYLDFYSGYANPDEALTGDNLSLWKSSSNADNFCVCKYCVGTMTSFHQTFDRWLSLQLEMNQCLEKVTDMFREIAKSQVGHENRGVTQDNAASSQQSQLEGLKLVLKKIEMHLERTFPYINQWRVDSLPSISSSQSVTIPTVESDPLHQVKVEVDDDEIADFNGDDDDDIFLPETSNDCEPEQEVKIEPDLSFPSEDEVCVFSFEQAKRKENLIQYKLATPVPTKSVKCLHCDKTFDDKASLKAHERTHLFPDTDDFIARVEERLKELKPSKRRISRSKHLTYKCIWCGDKEFPGKAQLENHMRTHTRETPFDCKRCPKSFAEMSTLRTHERFHTKPYQCSECGKQFAQKAALVSHLKRHAGDKSHTCEVCGKGFTMKAYLVLHAKRHVEMNHQCSECGKRFTYEKGLAAHMKTHSSNPEDQYIPCRACGLTFSGRQARDAHEKLHSETEAKPYKCKYCQRGFVKHRERRKHEYLNHEKEKDSTPKQVVTGFFQCGFCGKVLDTRKKLNSHEGSHKRPRPFQCPSCPKRFRDEKELTRHLRTHSSKANYKCGDCEESFSQKAHLAKHRRSIHGEKKPFKCPVCLQGFSLEHCLIRHAKRIHSQQWNQDKSAFTRGLDCEGGTEEVPVDFSLMATTR